MYTMCKVHLYVVCVCLPSHTYFFFKLALMSHVAVYRPALFFLVVANSIIYLTSFFFLII